MPNHVVHFAIHADDLPRARAFYEQVFGWTFEPWGPPDFFLASTGEGGIRGALQKRRDPVEGRGMTGFECTVGVEDVAATARSVEAHGGRILVPEMEIPTVGRMIQFEDTEGNVVCAMRYEDGVL